MQVSLSTASSGRGESDQIPPKSLAWPISSTKDAAGLQTWYGHNVLTGLYLRARYLGELPEDVQKCLASSRARRITTTMALRSLNCSSQLHSSPSPACDASTHQKNVIANFPSLITLIFHGYGRNPRCHSRLSSSTRRNS